MMMKAHNRKRARCWTNDGNEEAGNNNAAGCHLRFDDNTKYDGGTSVDVSHDHLNASADFLAGRKASLLSARSPPSDSSSDDSSNTSSSSSYTQFAMPTQKKKPSSAVVLLVKPSSSSMISTHVKFDDDDDEHINAKCAADTDK
jgi:hypothetical protein